MRIGLHDADKTGFPNLALMKLSAWHKAHGDDVRWWIPMEEYDKVYSSKVFNFTPEEIMLPEDTVKGGTGYGIYDELPEEVDCMFPDYSIYPHVDYAVGFLTRGCIRNCPWCVVPKKEGAIRAYSTWQQVKRPDSKKILFLDNNVLACPHGIEQIRDMVGKNIRIDFNQGLDARLITPEVAKLLSKLKWNTYIRMSCDTNAMLPIVKKAILLLKEYRVKPYKIFVYALVKETSEAEFRVKTLRSMGVNVFAQPYRDFENRIEPSDEQKMFARWVNHKAIFNTVLDFKDYKRSVKRG